MGTFKFRPTPYFFFFYFAALFVECMYFTYNNLEGCVSEKDIKKGYPINR